MPFRSRAFLIRIALIALLAMMANALMPAASQLIRASAAGKALPLGEICSISAQTKSGDPTKSALSGTAACAYCTLHADHPAVLPAPSADIVVAAERKTDPDPCHQAPDRLAAWSSASPRGPPALS